MTNDNMNLLTDLYNLAETKEDLSKLPQDVMTSIKSNIRKGAEDLEQKWANALELVIKAYQVDGVQRPDPSMDSAWKQYEENLQYAVQQLAKSRGMNADWRMSSSIFHEALEKKPTFHVTVHDADINESYTIRASSITDVIKLFENTPFEVKTRQQGDTTQLLFSRWNIYDSLRVFIKPIQSTL